MNANTEQRRRKLKRLLKKESEARALLVTNETNVSYLTGFSGDSSVLLITPQHEVLISDPRYTIQIAEECPGLDAEIRAPGQSLLQRIARLTKRARISALALEADCVSWRQLEAFREALPGIDLVSTTGLVEQLREIKDKEEIAEIREAVRLAERAFGVVRAGLRGDQTEREIAHQLEEQIRLFGGRGCSFTPIVGVGDRAALAHYRPGQHRLEENNLLLVDWGAIKSQYMSDLTRVLVRGKPSARLTKIYETVRAAQQAAIRLIRPGAVMQDVDAAARKVIGDAGYGKRFGHSLGHGIGLEIHEQPRLAMRESRALQAGMVVTVEPGIYIPGWGGVRLEDDVLVTRDGHEVLSSLPLELEANLVA